MRLFARWLSSFDPRREPPPRGRLPSDFQRSRPYIYTDAEIGSIIVSTKALPSIYGLHGLNAVSDTVKRQADPATSAENP